MLVRVHVRPDAGFTARPLRGVLTVSSEAMSGATATGADLTLEETKTMAGASEPEKLETTFNFLVPATAVKPGARLAAAVYEAAGTAAGRRAGDAPRASPPPARCDLGVQGRAHGAGRGDGARRRRRAAWSTTSPARRKRVEDHLFDVYPVQKVNVRWREPLRFTTRIGASAGLPGAADGAHQRRRLGRHLLPPAAGQGGLHRGLPGHRQPGRRHHERRPPGASASPSSPAAWSTACWTPSRTRWGTTTAATTPPAATPPAWTWTSRTRWARRWAARDRRQRLVADRDEADAGAHPPGPDGLLQRHLGQRLHLEGLRPAGCARSAPSSRPTAPWPTPRRPPVAP